ncbi:uncharacterized protein PITG_11945 [Phytophthora infestans T30-4]|uniref:Uncharacterized protein n=1 Tax=Phytophthora infestans (strain T30-4) TaxID=403677 RepID=D0NHL0_PHYIT|nr:uncharacterized protein PITG_11945 [Phytophthora infestans T30-4]EEY58935.1 conserved hypothetical protein [Phytophthora infestans T30-4]|eukprot:XP_002901408.1 conserved hypothetical protein [Phytophthora infestans T30-4]
MLQEAKQICYDEGQHAIHIICWTRELAAKWSTVFTSLQFPDGILNEQPRDRYHIRLLNISRFMDEAAIDMFLQAHFSGTYTTWQEPCTGYNNVLQTDTWDIFFKCHTCPQFLDSKPFINWNGTKILVHHVSKSASPPCFSCGAKGHLRTVSSKS